MELTTKFEFFVIFWTLYVSKIDAGKKGGEYFRNSKNFIEAPFFPNNFSIFPGSNIIITGGGGGGCDGWGGCGSGSLVLSSGWGKKGKKGGDNIVIHGGGGGCCHKKHVNWHPSHWHHHQHHHGGGGWGEEKKTEIKIKPIIIPMKIPMPIPVMSWGGGHMGGGGGWGDVGKMNFHKPAKMYLMDDWPMDKHPMMEHSEHSEHDKGWSSSWMMEGLDHWGDDGW